MLTITRPSLLIILVFVGLTVASFSANAIPLVATVPVATAGGTQSSTPGVAIAQDITQLTGVAISPLLGVSAVGAWRYFHSAKEERARLPWHCQMWFWGAAALILGLCLGKDLIGTAMPHWLVQPLHFIELLENKISAGLAGGTLVPLIAMHMAEALSGTSPTATTLLHASHLPLAMILLDGTGWGLLITLPVTVLVFCLVCVCSHAVHILVCLCPVGILATLLKVVKNVVLGLLVALSALHPIAGFAFALLIIIAACFCAGRAVRLTAYGSLMAGDTVTSRIFNKRDIAARNPAFLNVRIAGLPVRTFGYVIAEANGQVTFESRRFYFGAIRRIVLSKTGLTVGKCLFHPVLLQAQDGQAVQREIVHFFPRCRGHEESIAHHLGIAVAGERSPGKPLTLMEQWART